MGRKCPIYGIAIYMDCIDCDYKLCNMKYKYDTICIGIDQSYSNTGISVSADGVLKMVGSINLLNYNNNSKKRKVIYNKIKSIINKLIGKSKNIICVIERIRLRSQGFLNINYIKSIGALNALIVDLMYEYNIKVYSVDTRCWKSQVVGTSKPKQNDYGVPDEKWPTVYLKVLEVRYLLICLTQGRLRVHLLQMVVNICMIMMPQIQQLYQCFGLLENMIS